MFLAPGVWKISLLKVFELLCLHFQRRQLTFGEHCKDSLVKIQTFVSYLEIVWYDAAGFIIPQSVVLDLMQDE